MFFLLMRNRRQCNLIGGLEIFCGDFKTSSVDLRMKFQNKFCWPTYEISKQVPLIYV